MRWAGSRPDVEGQLDGATVGGKTIPGLYRMLEAGQENRAREAGGQGRRRRWTAADGHSCRASDDLPRTVDPLGRAKRVAEGARNTS